MIDPDPVTDDLRALDTPPADREDGATVTLRRRLLTWSRRDRWWLHAESGYVVGLLAGQWVPLPPGVRPTEVARWYGDELAALLACSDALDAGLLDALREHAEAPCSPA